MGRHICLGSCKLYKQYTSKTLGRKKDTQASAEVRVASALGQIDNEATVDAGPSVPLVDSVIPPRHDEGKEGRTIFKLPMPMRKRNTAHARRRQAVQYEDILPPLSLCMPEQHPPEHAARADNGSGHPIEHQVGEIGDFQTEANEYGVFRVYKGGRPTFLPVGDRSMDSVADSPNFRLDSSFRGNRVPKASKGPFDDASTELLMSWFYNGTTTKSSSDLNKLVHDVILAPGFNADHLRNFDASRAAKLLDNHNSGDPQSVLSSEDGWIETSVEIPLPPADRGSHAPEADTTKYSVAGLFYRRPIEVIKAAFAESSTETFHTVPFEQYWKSSPDVSAERLYSEIYDSDVHIQDQEDLRQSAAASKANVECLVVPILIWSDSTHLSTFGSASLWPAYIYIGTQSKYDRGKPSSFAAHHTAYMPKLDDAIQDFYTAEFGKPATAEVLTHLRRELMHAVWNLLLDDEFKEACEKGVEILFPDGIVRRIFIRIYIYAADYPEKVLLSGIKYLGQYPCPRCGITKDRIPELGTKHDMRRREIYRRIDDKDRQNKVEVVRGWIFQKGVKINSDAVRQLLKDQVPTRNTFSGLFSRFGLNFYRIFAPDLLHEFEIGVWKAILTHLLRILYAAGGDLIQELNERYRRIPTFGQDTIRKFSNNVSAMKKLAGRDFEDLLQCAIPAFEGLLDEQDNNVILDLLFELATWHGLAKLRLHSTSTINDLEGSVIRLGTALRRFRSSTCERFTTKDLPTEEAARGRRKVAAAKKKSLGAASKSKDAPQRTQKGKNQASSKDTRVRKLNLATYKLHALGDYPAYIRMYGTTDNFSSWIGELEHRHCKRHYPRVHKGRFTAGIARHIRRERILHNIQRDCKEGEPPRKKRKTGGKSLNSEKLPPSSPEQRYQMSNETRHPIQLSTWLGESEGDPALEGFLDQLKDHLLSRILKVSDDGDDHIFSDEDRLKLVVLNGRIYKHKVIRINYTTYDMRRDQDSLNPRTHANIMLLSHDEAHPYWYARILGVYHVVVQHPSLAAPQSIDFLHIRWYGSDPNMRRKSGWKARRLPRIGFVKHEADNETGFSPAFGFIDPSNIIRGVHIIPAFHSGSTGEDLPPSTIARLPSEGDLDWNFYYVNIFADRDLFMRYRGGGVGHKSTRSATNAFLNDRDPADLRRNTVPADLQESDAEMVDVDVLASQHSQFGGNGEGHTEVDDVLSQEEQDYEYVLGTGEEGLASDDEGLVSGSEDGSTSEGGGGLASDVEGNEGGGSSGDSSQDEEDEIGELGFARL